MSHTTAELLPHIAGLNSCRDEMLDLLQRWCNQNSGTFHTEGVLRVSELIAAEFSKLGGTSRPVTLAPFTAITDQGQEVVTPLGPALHWVKRPEIKPQVLMCIHMDTVYSPEDPFQTCRWLDEQRLNGPGVIDAKGGLVVMLYALKALEASPWASNLGWQVFINPDEEIGSPGSAPTIQKLAREVDCGLLFEPELPSGDLVSWRRGSGNFVFVVRGRAAHAGRDFAAGRNAVAAMCQLMAVIHTWNTHPEITWNVGRVSGGGALNIVPDLAVGRINIRVRTEAQQQEVERRLAELIAQTNRDGDGIRVELHGGFTSPPKEVSPGTEALMRRIEVCGQDLGMEIRWQGSGGASDGNKFAAAGLPNIDSLGPAGGEIHSSREFLRVDSLVPKAQLTALILLSMARDAAAGRPILV